MTSGDLPLFLVAAGVYLERDGKILILQRATGVMIGFWTLPSGILDPGIVTVDIIPSSGKDLHRLLLLRGRAPFGGPDGKTM